MPQKTTHFLPGIKVELSQPLGKLGGQEPYYQQGDKLCSSRSMQDKERWQSAVFIQKCSGKNVGMCLPLEAQISSTRT